MPTNIPLTAAISSLLLTTAACTGLEPAAIGVAVSSAQTGVALLSDSSLSSFEFAEFPDVVTAVETASNELGMRTIRSRQDQIDRQWWRFGYGDGHTIQVAVEFETPRVTSVRLRFRSEGERGIATLFLAATLRDLEHRGAFLVPPRSAQQSNPQPTAAAPH